MRIGPLVLAVVAPVVGAGCGSTAPTASGPAERGEAIVADRGCVACHGSDGSGGLGPPWQGLAGSDVELANGTTIVADTAYLTRSITDPEAETVAGYSIQMPQNALTPDEVADVVAYLETLTEQS